MYSQSCFTCTFMERVNIINIPARVYNHVLLRTLRRSLKCVIVLLACFSCSCQHVKVHPSRLSADQKSVDSGPTQRPTVDRLVIQKYTDTRSTIGRSICRPMRWSTVDQQLTDWELKYTSSCYFCVSKMFAFGTTLDRVSALCYPQNNLAAQTASALLWQCLMSLLL